MIIFKRSSQTSFLTALISFYIAHAHKTVHKPRMKGVCR